MEEGRDDGAEEDRRWAMGRWGDGAMVDRRCASNGEERAGDGEWCVGGGRWWMGAGGRRMGRWWMEDGAMMKDGGRWAMEEEGLAWRMEDEGWRKGAVALTPRSGGH